jgi:hypothetical protein
VPLSHSLGYNDVAIIRCGDVLGRSTVAP